MLHTADKKSGIALLDVSTGEFLCAEGKKDYIEKILLSFSPSEVVMPRSKLKDFSVQYSERFYAYHLDDWAFTKEFGEEELLKHFGTASLKGFGIHELDLAITAAGAALYYLRQTQQDKLGHIGTLSRIDEDRFVWLDKFTVRNLELVGSAHENASTLLHVMDKTISPMGARLMRRWILMPVKRN